MSSKSSSGRGGARRSLASTRVNTGPSAAGAGEESFFAVSGRRAFDAPAAGGGGASAVSFVLRARPVPVMRSSRLGEPERPEDMGGPFVIAAAANGSGFSIRGAWGWASTGLGGMNASAGEGAPTCGACGASRGVASASADEEAPACGVRGAVSGGGAATARSASERTSSRRSDGSLAEAPPSASMTTSASAALAAVSGGLAGTGASSAAAGSLIRRGAVRWTADAPGMDLSGIAGGASARPDSARAGGTAGVAA